MGVDGRLLMGDGIMINPYYIPKNIIQFLEYLVDKYPTILEYNYMHGVSRNYNIIAWGEEPIYLFPVDTVDRRPIINNNEQLPLMKPTINGINLDDKKIWEPSYEDFTIRLNDYPDSKEQIYMKTINHTLGKQHDVSDKYVTQKL